MIDPAALQMVLGVLTSWLERREREAIAYLIVENLGPRLVIQRRYPAKCDRPVLTIDVPEDGNGRHR